MVIEWPAKTPDQIREEIEKEESAGLGDENYSAEELGGEEKEDIGVQESGGVKNLFAEDLDRLAEEEKSVKEGGISDEEIDDLIDKAFKK